MPPPAEGFAARFVIGPALRTQPDRRLVTLVREGYEHAFEEIVRRYGKPLTRYAAAIVGGRAEDVTQDAFSKALLALRRDGNEIELRPWLFRIVRNTALNDLRDSPPSAEALAEVIASGANPAEELERRDELADLMRRLQSLPEAQRAAIVMRELEGLSHEEIASALGLSDGGARQAIYRARRSLRDGAGMLLPLPLLKALLAGAAGAGSPAVEATAGAAGVGGVAGAGVALKAAAATVLVAGAVGAGVAIDHNRHPHHSAPAEISSVVADDSVAPAAAGAGAGSGTTSAHGSSNESGRSDGSGSGSGHGDKSHGGASGGEHHASDNGNGLSTGSGQSGDDTHGGGHHSQPGDGDGSGSGSGPGPSANDGAEGSGSGRHSGGGSTGSSDSGGSSSNDGGGSDGGSTSGSDGSSGSGSESTPSDDGSGSGGSSGSSGDGGGDSGPGGGGGDDSSNFESSGDSHGGSGFSVQTQPQTQEEP